MSTVKLYELAQARDILDGWLEETEGEVTPEIAHLLDALEGEIKEKVERVGLYIREQAATADAIEAEAKRLTARAATRRKAIDFLKGYLLVQLERLGVPKVDGLLCTVAIHTNPPAVKTLLEANALYALEDARSFVKREERVTYALDRVKVLAAWKAGEPLPDAITVEQGSHIRVR